MENYCFEKKKQIDKLCKYFFSEISPKINTLFQWHFEELRESSQPPKAVFSTYSKDYLMYLTITFNLDFFDFKLEVETTNMSSTLEPDSHFVNPDEFTLYINDILKFFKKS